MNADDTTRSEPTLDVSSEPLTYEPPMITDQGSLVELTLHTTGSFTDGAGFGGGSL